MMLIKGRSWRNADLIVVGIVAGRHLERTGAKFGIDILVGDHGNLTVEHRHEGSAANQVPVAIIVGMNSHAPYRRESSRGASC